MSTSPLLQGGMGVFGTLGPVSGNEGNSNNPDNDSSSLSPQVKRKAGDFNKTYEVNGELPIIRFLINNRLSSDSEIEIFERAIDYLRWCPSAEEILKSPPPRNLACSNVILLDIKDARDPNNKLNFHTICLWKKTDQVLLIIDPSNYTFSQKFEQNNLSGFKIMAKKHAGDLFYKSWSVEGPLLTNQNSTEVNKDSRDCIDIAVKIAFSINISQQTVYDFNTVESRIDYLSNQKKVNTKLLQGDAETRIGWLQSSAAWQREETIRLLFENKEYLAMIDGIEDIQKLQKLNNIRLDVAQSPRTSHLSNDLLNQFKVIKPNGKIPFNKFCQHLEDIIDMMKKELEAKEIKEKVKGSVNESFNDAAKAGKKGEKKA